MRSIGLLLKKSLVFLTKMALVAIPAVVAASCAYRQALLEYRREALAEHKEYVAVLHKTSDALEQQGRIIEQMKGEMNMLAVMVAARTGTGLPPLPLRNNPSFESLFQGSAFTWQTPSAVTATAVRTR